MDHSASLLTLGVGAGVAFFNVQNGWVQGVRSIKASQAHVLAEYSNRITVRDSYFFLTQFTTSTSYGFECYGGADDLVENNIFHAVSGPLTINSACDGTVLGYNFAIDDYYTAGAGFINAMSNVHAAGNANLLYEGNHGPQIYGDLFHGTHNVVTIFRNRIPGTSPSCWVGGATGGSSYGNATTGACTSNRIPIVLNSFSRVFNVIGNVLGQSGVQTSYEGSSPIYGLGGGNSSAGVTVKDDPNVALTMMRWANYDTVNGGNRFVASEVPSALTGTAAPFSNPVPASQTLPASFYYSSQPSWWPSGKAWPPIGPDVSGGSEANVGGHSNSIPAEDCYFNIMGGPTSGMGNVLSFNAANCYSASVSGPVTPIDPPSGLNAVVN